MLPENTRRSMRPDWVASARLGADEQALHIMLETWEANLVTGMRWIQTTLTIRYNRRHRISGHLFQGRYKSVVVDPEERGYSATLSDYIHLNPVRARLVGLEDRLVDYRWSSYPCYARAVGRPVWLETRRVLGELGVEDTSVGRREYAKRVRQRAAEVLAGEEESEVAELRRGWCLGKESFRERMLRLLETAAGKTQHRSPRDANMRRELGEEEARKLLQAALDYLGMQAKELTELRKGDSRKLAIAALVRQRTSVSNRWIAEALSLGHFSRVSQAIRHQDAMKLAGKLEAQVLS